MKSSWLVLGIISFHVTHFWFHFNFIWVQRRVKSCLFENTRGKRKTAMQRHSAKDLHDILKFIAFWMMIFSCLLHNYKTDVTSFIKIVMFVKIKRYEYMKNLIKRKMKTHCEWQQMNIKLNIFCLYIYIVIAMKIVSKPLLMNYVNIFRLSNDVIKVNTIECVVSVCIWFVHNFATSFVSTISAIDGTDSIWNFLIHKPHLELIMGFNQRTKIHKPNCYLLK